MTVQNRGMNHIGLITHDIDKTIDFYQNVLGFEPIAYYLRELQPEIFAKCSLILAMAKAWNSFKRTMWMPCPTRWTLA